MGGFILGVFGLILILALAVDSGIPTQPDTIRAVAAHLDTQCPDSKAYNVWVGRSVIEVNCDDGSNTTTPVELVLETWYNK